jgi:hypothetical protein
MTELTAVIVDDGSRKAPLIIIANLKQKRSMFQLTAGRADRAVGYGLRGRSAAVEVLD